MKYSPESGIFPKADHPLKVLLVEDEFLIRWSIAEILRQAGHTVVEAGDAAAAREELAPGREAPDVALLDLRLPDSDDLSLLDDIRRLAPDAAVVMMTAHGTPEIAAAALDRGAYDVMSKPFDMHALEPILLEAHRAHTR